MNTLAKVKGTQVKQMMNKAVPMLIYQMNAFAKVKKLFVLTI